MDCFTSFAMTDDEGSSKYQAQRQAMDVRSFLDNEVLA